jgi:hypothetical protein
MLDGADDIDLMVAEPCRPAQSAQAASATSASRIGRSTTASEPTLSGLTGLVGLSSHHAFDDPLSALQEGEAFSRRRELPRTPHLPRQRCTGILSDVLAAASRWPRRSAR